MSARLTSRERGFGGVLTSHSRLRNGIGAPSGLEGEWIQERGEGGSRSNESRRGPAARRSSARRIFLD
jgi:hypothetical protein